MSRYLGEVEEDLDGVGDDIHAGDAPVAAADECEDDFGGSALYQPLTALRGQPGGGLCSCRHIIAHTYTNTKRGSFVRIGDTLQY